MPKVKSNDIKACVLENLRLIEERGEELTGMVFIATAKSGMFYATIKGVEEDLNEAIGTAHQAIWGRVYTMVGLLKSRTEEGKGESEK